VSVARFVFGTQTLRVSSSLLRFVPNARRSFSDALHELVTRLLPDCGRGLPRFLTQAFRAEKLPGGLRALRYGAEVQNALDSGIVRVIIVTTPHNPAIPWGFDSGVPQPAETFPHTTSVRGTPTSRGRRTSYGVCITEESFVPGVWHGAHRV